MANCTEHPGRKEATKLFGKSYCKECKDGIAAAVKKVDKHVEPKECFIVYEGKDDWEPIGGTGCAHWVMHQLGKKSTPGDGKCLAGYVYRVKNAIAGFHEIDIKDVKEGDLYVNPDKSHMGLVSKVAKAKDGADPAITIRHDSSAQGKVAENEFATYFKGKGTFMR